MYLPARKGRSCQLGGSWGHAALVRRWALHRAWHRCWLAPVSPRVSLAATPGGVSHGLLRRWPSRLAASMQPSYQWSLQWRSSRMTA